MMRARAELYEGVGLGLIVEWPSGVVFSNQTGGKSCLHPELTPTALSLHAERRRADTAALPAEARARRPQKGGGPQRICRRESCSH